MCVLCLINKSACIMVGRRQPTPFEILLCLDQPSEEKTVKNILMYVKTVGRPNNILKIWARKSCWVTSNDWVPRGFLNFIILFIKHGGSMYSLATTRANIYGFVRVVLLAVV
jgi:hypothetical protein